ncbi:MAG: transposase [Chloroflexi bacterium]|nr:transposase [Chloroflexota bacterium]
MVDREGGKWSRSKTNQEYVSRTDPEATIIHSIRGGLRLAYKAHVAVSGKRGLVVTAAIATTGIAGEEHLLNEVLRCHTWYTEMPVREAVADTKYGTLANYVSLDRAGIAAFIPPHERTNGINGFWGKDHFRYVLEQDIYLCPAGKTMKRFAMCEGKKRVAYRCELGTCHACQLNKKCTPHGNVRSVTRFVDQRLVEEARARIEDPLGRELMRQRKTRIEGIFALGKELHGLRRTRLMGRWKVQIQLWLTATVINLKRAIKALTNRSDGAALSNQQGSLSFLIAIATATRILASLTVN